MPLTELTPLISTLQSFGTHITTMTAYKTPSHHTKNLNWYPWTISALKHHLQINRRDLCMAQSVQVYTDTFSPLHFASLVVSDAYDSMTPQQIIFLKCEKRGQSPDDLASEFRKAAYKVNQGRLSTPFIPAKLYAVVVALTDEGDEALERISWPRAMNVRRLQAVEGAAMWWYEKDVCFP